VERSFWTPKHPSLPPFPCPRCTVGRLKVRNDDIGYKTAHHLTMAYQEAELYPDVNGGLFHAFMVCSHEKCGEVVSVAGDFTVEYHFRGHDFNNDPKVDEDFEYRVRSMRPAPPIITFSSALDALTREHLEKSFELFWVDLGACANRLRIVVESLLDQIGVPRTRAGANKNLDLNTRIVELDAMKPGHSDVLHALRYVGNIGSHEGEAGMTEVLDCYELLEATLEELLDNKRAKLAAKAASIKARRGRPT
jgi:hypothetical protein